MALADDLPTNANAAKRLKNGNQEREAHSLKDQLEVAKFEAANAAVSSGGTGFRIQKIRPGGTT